MLDLMMTLVVPLTLGLVAVYAACRRVDVYDALIQGAGEGLGTLARIIPSLVGLMTAVYMLRASGALDLAAQALAPLLDRVGVPAELLPLMLVRPISGSAALGVGAELITSSGPDSYVGRVAAVMLGSTETTFYTIAVYFGAVGISRTRYAVPAALCAEGTGDKTLLVKELIGSPEAVDQIAAVLPQLLPKFGGTYRTLGDSVPFGMMKWLSPELDAAWDRDIRAYLGLAFD